MNKYMLIIIWTTGEKMYMNSAAEKQQKPLSAVTKPLSVIK